MEVSDSATLSSDKFSHVLRKLIDAISSVPTGKAGLDIIYEEALRSLEESINIERASILLFDPDGVMRFKAWLGISDRYRKSVEGHTPWTQDAVNPESIVIYDTYEAKDLASHLPTFDAENIRALAFIPLLYRSKVIGKFMLYAKSPYDFAMELEPVRTIAQLVAYAVVRKKIEEQLGQSENRTKAILENEPECVNMINSKGIVLEMNPAGLALLETEDTSKVIGKSIYPMLQKKYRNPFRKLIDKVCHGSRETLEFELFTFNGDLLYLETHAAPLYSDEYGETVLLAITRDITGKKRAERQREELLVKEKEARLGAEKSIQLRDDFLSMASHELRTPLTPIMMNFQLLERYLRSMRSDSPKAGLLLKVFENTDRQFDRFLKLVENLLDVSRITADRLVLTKEHVNLSELLNDVLKRFRIELMNAGCELTTTIQENVSGHWDRSRIEQVIINLLSNAIKYGLNRPIDVSLTLEKNDDPMAKLVITDKGIGIDKIDHEKIFSRFERVASVDHFGGLGLGLFITRNILHAHGGEIEVTSELGKGAKFTVKLPLNLM